MSDASSARLLGDPRSRGGSSSAERARLVYALVACGTTVLADFTATSGNFPAVSRLLLNKFSREDGRMSYVYDSYAFHYIAEEGVVYLCLTHEHLKRRIAFAFLEDVKERFKATYKPEEINEAHAFAMNQTFSRILRKRMEHFSEDGEDRGRVQVEGTTVENIEKLLNRGEKIELLVDSSGEDLRQSAFTFEHSAKSLRNTLWWRSTKKCAMITIVVLFVLYFIIASQCGGLGLETCV